MRKLFLILAVAMALVGCAAKEQHAIECEIVGRIDNYNALGYVYLTDEWDAHRIIDSAELYDNTFHFKRVKYRPTLAQLMLESGRPVSHLLLEEGKILVSGDYLNSSIQASGTPANDAFLKMIAQNSNLFERYSEAVGSGDEAAIKAIEQEQRTMLYDCMAQNSGNVLGLFMLYQLSTAMPAMEVVAKIESMPEILQQVPMAKRLKQLSERKFKTEPQAEGSDYVPHYIDIVQPNVDGKEVSLKSVVENKQNRYVLLDFWASWCGPCMKEIPVLREAYKLYHSKGFEIYGVSLDSREESWKQAVEKQNMQWVNVSLLQEFNCPATEEYSVESIPTNFLIDCSNGVIVAKNLRGEAVLEKLAELFK